MLFFINFAILKEGLLTPLFLFMSKGSKLIVIALGGNALNSPEGRGDYLEQVQNAEIAAKEIAKAVKLGYRVVITHGNGPQVGNILLQQEYSKDHVSPMPLAVCGAQSQGQIGTILVEVLNNEFQRINLKTQALGIVTHVLVDKKDKAFKNPTKPIGPIYTPTEASQLKKEGLITLKKIRVAAFRRVVPSPLPIKILELEGIKAILRNGLIPIAVGGGGIPIIQNNGKIKLVDAVIDKDLASEVLASRLKADSLVILTNVQKAALNLGKPNQILLNTIPLRKAKDYFAQGHFPPGSMGPKMEAAIKFIENSLPADRQGGKRAIITDLKSLIPALNGKAGTIIS